MRFQFSLRFLLFAAFVCSVLFVYMKWIRDAWNSSPSAVLQVLEKADARLFGDDLFEGQGFSELEFSKQQVSDLKTLTPIATILFKNVKTKKVLVAASRAKSASRLTIRSTEPGINPIGCDFSHLKDLHVGGIDNRQLVAWLEVANNVEYLSVSTREPLQVTTVAAIAESSSIKVLRLNGMRIEVEHVRELSALPTLEYLFLHDCKIKRDALSGLKSFPSLTELGLLGSTYDTHCLPELARLKNVTSLDLSESAISDFGVRELSKLSHLRHLSLYGCTQITGRCVSALVGMSELKFLNVLKSTVETDKRLQHAGYMLREWAY